MPIYTPNYIAKDRVIRMNEVMRNYQRVWGESVLWAE